MSYQKHWITSFAHKSVRMMTTCTGSSMIRRYVSEITVEPVLFLYMLSTFSQYALFQDLVYSKVCWRKFSKESGICPNLHNAENKEFMEIVQTESSHYILVSTIALIAPSILIAMYLGSWSDDEKFGRKWAVVFPPLGGVCACLVYIVISVVEDAPVGWICLASFLSGLTGGFVGCIMSCMTFVASVTSEENRTVRISRLEAMTFFGGTLGPFISGTMLEITGHAYAFFYMMLCYAFAFLYALIFVKDVSKIEAIIQKDEPTGGTLRENEDNENDIEGDSKRSASRCRNKSSDTIPSSVAATTLSTTSGGEDFEQKVGLLSASSLQVSVLPTEITTGPFYQDDINQAGSIPQASCSCLDHIEVCQKEIGNYEIAPIPQMTSENEQSMIISVVSSNNHDSHISFEDHHHHHHQHDLDQGENRNGLGSNRNSSLQSHGDDGSSAASDDDRRKIIRQRHSSSFPDDETGIHSNDPESRSSGSSKSCCLKYFGTTHFLSAVMTVMRRRENGKRTLLLLSISAGFMFMVITAGEMDVAYLFARAEPLKWDYQLYSYYFGFKYGFGAFVLLVGTPFLQKMGVQDTTLAIVGIISRMAALVLYGTSVNTYMAFTVPLVAVFGVFTIPATRSLLSKLVNPDEQGKMFAFVAMMEDICTLAASLTFNSVYPLTRPILPGLIFILAAVSLIIPISIMCFVRWKMQKFQRDQAKAACRRTSKAHLHSVDGNDPAALLCLPRDFAEVSK